jgi:thioredoxin reductase (NADPH)
MDNLWAFKEVLVSGEKLHDVLIVGGGPAGLAAGIYAGRAGLDAVVLDGMGGGGQMNIIDRIENYPGVMDVESGAQLAEIMRKQMESFGLSVTFDQAEEAEAADDRVTIKGSETYRTKAMLIATGSRHRPLGVPGEGKLMGRGVSVCATCDGPFFKGQPVVVVGGGDSALMEAIYLSKVVKHITIIHRRDKLRAEKYLQDLAFAADNIEFVWDAQVEEILGDKEVTGVKYKNKKSGESQTIEVPAVFVFVGLLPNTGFVKEAVDLDENGFVITDARMRTSHPRIFAAGDVRVGSARQVGAAVGDGINAQVCIQEFLDTDTPPRDF